MKRSKTSRAWMSEHIHDPYVQKAKAENYRSRAAFKLIEIHAKDRLFRQGMTVIDLGAAPGSWSQVALQCLKNQGKVIALDLLEIVPMQGLTVLQGDFQEEAVLQALLSHLPEEKVDIVLSDMAPNISGIAISDQARMMNLAELALDFCLDFLKDDGVFLIKLFQGHGFDEFVRLARVHFCEVSHRKPDASRDRSSEVYLLCKKIKQRKS